MSKILKIDEQLRDLFPPLTKDEFKLLETNILRDGCNSPLFIWNDYIVDGHNRYNICTKNNIKFEVVELAYENKDEVIGWMVDTQLGRRNLTPIQKIAIAEKYRPIYVKKAKENQLSGLKQNNTVTPKSAERITPISTRDALAKIACVGHDTYNKGKKILDSDNKEIKQKVMKGEMKINTAYNELFPKPKSNPNPKIELKEERIVKKEEVKLVEKEVKDVIKKCIRCGKEKNLDGFYIGHDKCKECEESESIKTIKKNEVFKDINGNPLPISENAKMNDNEFKEMLQDLKTPKNYEDYINPNNEIELIKESCSDLIWTLESKLFTINKVIEKMNNEHIELTENVLEQHIEQINKIKIKLKERIGE